MKSKSFDLKRSTSEKAKANKTFDFTNYYKSAAETKKAVENTKVTADIINKENKFSKSKNGTPSKPERTPNKKKNKLELEPLDISHIDIEDPNSGLLVAKSTPLNESRGTSTPHASAKGEQKVKSIMKNKSTTDSDDYMDSSSYSTSGKPKKRNKSVSFMLDDAEEVVVKKTKSNESIEKKSDNTKKAAKELKVKKIKNAKKDVTGKENKKSENVNTETASAGKNKKPVKDNKLDNDIPKDSASNKEEKIINKKGKFKKMKNPNPDEEMEVSGESNNNEEQTEMKNRKAKKKKHTAKTPQSTETSEGEGEGEPAAKTQKKDNKPEEIAENLESLSIGDNAHTLTNLLDEMKVVDTDKKKKKRVKKKQPVNTSSSESADLEKIEEGKEKVKWRKRKWNKDKKGEVVEEDVTATSVIVDNLPLSMVCDYKKPLADHFGKYGLIKKIGVAEVYPEQESKPVFTTTIQFYSEGAANEALAEDARSLGGAALRVRRALPPAQTTLVVRSYGALSDQSVSSAFAAAGRIRSIRHLVKGRKAIATAFVEFEGPEALARALELGAAARIGGKRAHAARYEPRRRRTAAASAPARDRDSEDDDDTSV